MVPVKLGRHHCLQCGRHVCPAGKRYLSHRKTDNVTLVADVTAATPGPASPSASPRAEPFSPAGLRGHSIRGLPSRKEEAGISGRPVG